MNDLANTPRAGLGEAAELALLDLRRPSLAAVWITCAVALGDVVVFALALWFGQYAAQPASAFQPIHAAVWAVAAGMVGVATLWITAGYTPRVLARPHEAVLRPAAALVLPVLLLSLASPDGGGPVALAATVALVVTVVPSRLCCGVVIRWIRGMRLLDRRAVIAGGGLHASSVIRGLARSADNDIRVFGIFDDRDDVRSPVQVLGVPKLGGYEDLIAFVRRSEIDMVIVSLPLEVEHRISWLLDSFRVLPVEVRLSAYSRDYAFARRDRMPLISAIQHSFSPECRLTKRLFDLLIAAAALLPVVPIMLLAAIAIRLESRGPILFKQRRHGYNDRVIEIWKFRSMYHEQSDPEARRVVTRGDPRVTRVGRFLRRSSIDELPQLFNVLRGDLSLVGPRPHAIDAVSSGSERFAQIVDGYSARHRLPPGITGWAQIHGWRGEIDAPEKLRARFEHDLHYIENWSLWLDLRILLRTPLSLLNTRSAY